MKLDIIGVPMNLGCDREGADKAPDHLRSRDLLAALRKVNSSVFDLGNIYVPDLDLSEKYASDSKMKFFEPILEVNRNIAELVYASIGGGAIPLTLGGDHSVALGTISGSSSHYDRLGVIWIDAHGDMNTPESSPSGNVHGMILAALMDFGEHRMKNLYFEGRKIDPRNVVLVGSRSLDQGERELIREENIKVFDMDVIREIGMKSVIEQIEQHFKSRDIFDIHCSLDIDSVDPEFAPGTGTKEAGGITPEELFSLLDYITDSCSLRSMDLVELNPLLDVGDMTSELCLSVLKRVAWRLD